MRSSLRPLLLVLLACGGGRGAVQRLSVTVVVEPSSRADCVRVVVQGPDLSHSGQALVRKPTLRVAVLRGPTTPSTVRVFAQGLTGDCHDAARLLEIERSVEVDAEFEGEVTLVELSLPGPQVGEDLDQDGYAGGFPGAPDCDDGDRDVHPGVVEDCLDGKDNDCASGADCADPACVAKACGLNLVCAQGACQPLDGGVGESDCANGRDDDGNGKTDCQDGTCEGRTCQSTDRCITTPFCSAGACAGPKKTCSPAPGSECQVGRCQSATGACEYSQADAGQPCPGGRCGADGKCWQDFPFPTSNFDPGRVSPAGAAYSLSCGESVIEASPNAVKFTNWCGQVVPQAIWVFPDAGVPAGPVLVVPMRGLFLDAGSVLRVRGSRPVALAVFGDATLKGDLLVEAPGPSGVPAACGAGASGGGGPGGGGGGAFGQSGGNGGAKTGGGASPGGNGGTAGGTAQLVPLRGGCPGGNGGNSGGAGGAGAGAVQLSAAGTLTVDGVVGAPGRAGQGGGAGRGGGGGGSGGAILLEAARLLVGASAVITANGGGGGEGGGLVSTGASGKDGRVDSEQASEGGNLTLAGGGPGGNGGAASSGAQGGGSSGTAGGGGGGAVGRLRFNAWSSCGLSNPILSPRPTLGGDAGC